MFSRNAFVWLPLAALTLSVSALHARADGPISNNPDDYDVAKYQRLYDQSVARLQNARGLLESLNHRVHEIGERLEHEQAELAALAQDRDNTIVSIRASEQRIGELRQAMANTQAQMADLRQNDIPRAEMALLDEQRRASDIQSHMGQAEQNAEALEANARDKAAQAQALNQNADQKKAALAQIQAQFNDVNGKLQAAEAQRAQLQQQLDALRARVGQLTAQINQTKAQTDRLAAQTTQLQQKSQQADAVATQAETEALNAERAHAPDAFAKRNRANMLRRQANAARAQYDQSQRQLDAANAQLANLNNQLNQANASLASAEQQFRATDASVVSLREQVASLQPALRQAQRDFEQAQALAGGAAVAAAQAQSQANQARQTVNDLKAALTASQQRAAELQNRVTQMHQRLDQLNASIGGMQSEIVANEQKIQQLREHAQLVAAQMDEKGRRVAGLQNEYAQAAQERDQAAAVTRDSEAETAMLGQRLRDVTNNLNQGIAIAANDGANDGGADGNAEGSAQASSRGQAQGREIGEREGQAQGTQDGIAKAQADGSAQGTQLGTTEGTDKGTTEGQAKGQSEGTAQGREKGLADGYEAGRSEGYTASYPKGEEAGHAMGGVQKGHDEGYAQGKARAVSEGTSRGSSEGTTKGQQEFYNANLANSTIANHPSNATADANGIVAAPSDVKSANFDYPQWGNYNPRRGYPNADMQNAYNVNYQRAFMASAAAAYDRVFPDTYRQAHDEAFNRVRQDYANRDYPNEKKAAFDAARSAAYDAAYKQASDAAYQQAFQPAYDQARQAALPERHDEGRAAGEQDGFAKGKDAAYNADLAQGRADGQKAGYDENYQPAYDAASTKAYNDVVAFFSTHAVLKFDGTVTADANNDGVYAPGETVSLTVAMKNFGKVSQSSNITVALSDQTSGLVLDSASDTLTALPGQTRAVVTGVTSFRVSPDAEAGKTESLTMTVKDGDNVLGTTQLTITVGYPYAVAAINRSDYPAAEQDNEVNVQVRNGSSKLSSNPVTAKLVSIDGLASVSTASADLGKLAAGETKTAKLSFTFSKDNANKVLGFEVQIFEGNWLLGKRRFQVDSAKRWQYNATSTGLFLVSSGDLGKRADDASKLAGLGFDAYDVRVEGQLTADVALKYLDKAIVIPSVTNVLGDGTAAALRAFLDRGGQVYAGQYDSARNTSVGSVLGSYMGNLTSLSLGDLAVYQGNEFDGNAAKALVVIGQDVRSESDADVAGDLVNFDLVRKSFADKTAAYLAALSSGNQDRVAKTRDALVFDLNREMRDNKSANANAYKNNKAALKLTAFINTALSKQGNERRAMLSLYPALDQARKGVEKDGWFRSTPIADLMKPLKKAYEQEILGRRGD